MPQIERRIVAPRACPLPQPRDLGRGDPGDRHDESERIGRVAGMFQDVSGQPEHNNGRGGSGHSRSFIRRPEVELAHDRTPARGALNAHHTQPINKSPDRRLHFCCDDQRVQFLHDMTVTQ